MARTPKERFTAPLTVERLDNEGRGVGHRDGKVVFVEGALPGEEVTYERLRNKPSFEVGRVLEIHRESFMRATPKCPHFGMGPGSCGGCAMQHINHAAQVAFKERVLLDALWHIGKVRPENLLPPIEGPSWGYRHRARLTVRYVEKKGGVLVGFHEKHSSFVADMHVCPILPRNVSEMLPVLRELVASLSRPDRVPQIELAVALSGRTALVFRHLEPLTDEDLAKLKAASESLHFDLWLQPKGPDSAYPVAPENRDALKLVHREFGVQIAFTPTDFTQVNPAMNEAMVSRAVRLLAPMPDSHVADFFCGLGNFTLALARRADVVIGLEGSEALVERARASARQNALSDKATFRARNLFTWSLDDWDALNREVGPIDRVLIDPPREGAEALSHVLSQTEKKPERVVYVSCNPATLARDLAILVHTGAWRVRQAGIMNMFPHTSHVESIAVLEPGQGKAA